ncbi:MAG: glycoside hydrolase family 43 protein [Bacteroidales bacterium]|nr:glycoside hydrolase family 43 protein [Bacteroidales bacterium]
MKKNTYTLLFLALAFALSILSGNAQAQKTKKATVPQTFTNPIGIGADPWVITAGEKFWYCGSGKKGIYISSSDSLHTILKKEKQMAFVPPPNEEYSKEIWAPELFYLQGRWYIYFAADSGKNEYHRMYVLEGGSDPSNPLNGEYVYKGKLASEPDNWAIDGTILEHGNSLYFIWSGWPGKHNVTQCLYISRMVNPYTLEKERFLISCPDQEWELNGSPTVNEGPEVIVMGNSVHIIYSASGSWTDDYCLGRLTCTNGNFLDRCSWTKTGPVFSRTDDVFGPGHASFVKIPGTNQWWIAYHAAREKGSGWDRNVRIQPFSWDGEIPVFGKPVSPNVPIQLP